MRWTDADGYRVTVYQKDGSEWKDTGFGYDLDAKHHLHQHGADRGRLRKTEELPKNLSPNETYKIGVSAYKEEPYFTESAGAGSTENPETGTSAGEETSAAEGAEGSTAGSGGTSTQKALTAKYYSDGAQCANDEISAPIYAVEYDAHCE